MHSLPYAYLALSPMDSSAGKNDADYFLADNEQVFFKKAHLNFDMSFNICLDIKATFIICTTDNC